MSVKPEPFESMLSKICDSVLRDMGGPSTKQARAELRDRFAMAALTGLLANPNLDRMPEDVWASDAYIFADAMLKARGND